MAWNSGSQHDFLSSMESLFKFGACPLLDSLAFGTAEGLCSVGCGLHLFLCLMWYVPKQLKFAVLGKGLLFDWCDFHLRSASSLELVTETDNRGSYQAGWHGSWTGSLETHLSHFKRGNHNNENGITTIFAFIMKTSLVNVEKTFLQSVSLMF